MGYRPRICLAANQPPESLSQPQWVFVSHSSFGTDTFTRRGFGSENSGSAVDTFGTLSNTGLAPVAAHGIYVNRIYTSLAARSKTKSRSMSPFGHVQPRFCLDCSNPFAPLTTSKFVEGFFTPMPTPGASDPPNAPLLASGGVYVSFSPYNEPSGTTGGIPAPPNSLATTLDASSQSGSGTGVKLFSGDRAERFNGSKRAQWEEGKNSVSEGPPVPQNSLATGAPNVAPPTAPNGVLPAGSSSGSGFEMGPPSLNSSALKDNYPADRPASFVAANATPTTHTNATPTTQTHATPTTQHTQTFGLGSASLNSSALKDNYPADTPASFIAANPDVHGVAASKARERERFGILTLKLIVELDFGWRVYIHACARE
ncbi:hypothetical protein B0H19DRAFT_1294555 [Mycena capillaripes]|nr:hypothetical protein B0H19DRAFT_1294555 [Mycena capillaripes]